MGWQHLDTAQYNSAGQERGLNPGVRETPSFKYFDVEPLFSEHPTLTKLEATPDELATPLVGVPGEMQTRNEGHGSGASIVIWLKLALLERGGLPKFLTKPVEEADRLLTNSCFQNPGCRTLGSETSDLSGIIRTSLVLSLQKTHCA